MKILIVDDNEENRYFLEVLLKTKGHTTRQATNGKEALRLLESDQPDLIISDILMPVMDGFQLCRTVKTNENFRSVPFIIYTATYTSPRDEDLALKMGADRFIIKPCEPDTLLKSIDEVVEEYLRRGGAPQIETAKEEEIFKLYNERLVKKLEQKMLAAEQELSARKAAETALRESRERLMESQRVAKMGDITYDIETGTYACSDTLLELFEFKPSENSDFIQTYRRMLSAEDQQRIAGWIERGIASQEENLEPIEYRILFRDGTFKYLVSEGRKEYGGGRPVRIFAIVQDITERKKQEETIRMALEEKNQLIRELYHRTKNNMQVIISMLMLQAMQYQDENIRELVKVTVNRIQTMSLVHEKLYQSEKLSTIKLDEYISDLIRLLKHTFSISSDKVTIVCDLQPIPALIDIAIPCGLIINELVSNAIKYAFPDNRKGTIKVELHPKDDGFISMRVSDNGIGMPPDFDFHSGKTIGLQTVAEITELQLQGKMYIERGSGFSCCVQFKNSLYRKRI